MNITLPRVAIFLLVSNVAFFAISRVVSIEAVTEERDVAKALGILGACVVPAFLVARRF